MSHMTTDRTQLLRTQLKSLKNRIDSIEEQLPLLPPWQNGIPLPKQGTVARRIWDICDAVSRENGSTAERRAVMERCRATMELNPATVDSRFQEWRRYHGLVNKKVARLRVAR